MPSAIAGRSLVRWSVAGDNFWKAAGGEPVRRRSAPELASVGLSPADIEMAVAGRTVLSHPPYILWALRFGALKGAALHGPVPSSLAMDVMHVDANQGENWREARMTGKPVLIGNAQMVRQDEHHRGHPYVYLTATTIYGLITDDEAWAEEAIAALPDP